MTHRILTLIAASAALATSAMAEVVPLSPTLATDGGPWVDMPENAVFDTAPLSYDDIVSLANLDDNPAVTTAKELEMIAMLSQVLGANPITN